jgi:outer membrane immunogenic protein
MKKFVFALTLVSALVQPFVSASAADFEPPPPTDDLRPATYDWSGMYVGASVGGTCFDGNVDIPGVGAVPTIPGPVKDCGYDISGHAGYNFQVDHMVFGLEGDLGYAKLSADSAATLSNFGQDWNGGIKGRFGYALDNTLIYGLAGYSMARAQYGETLGGPIPSYTTQEAWHHGWSVGMGVEHAITDVIRLRGEYAYTKYMTSSYTSACGAGCEVDGDFGNVHNFSIGMSYAF